MPSSNPAEKCGSVAEAVAIAVIKEWAARSGRVTLLPPHTVVLGSAPPSSQETKPSLPAFPQGSAAKPQCPGSCRPWFSDRQQHPPSLRSWRSASDEGLLRTLERDRRLDTWLKRHGLSLPNVKLALQTCVAMLLICVWMAIPPVYGVQQPPWSSPGWAGITVILLLEPTEGATLAKTVLRVAGTVLGVCLSALLLWALRASYSDVTDAVLLCGVLPPFCALCAYCKARYKPYAYLWTVCSLTPTIVVLFSYEVPEQQKPVFAAYRCFNIVVGALVVLATAKMPPLAVRPPPRPPDPLHPRAPSSALSCSAAFAPPAPCPQPLQPSPTHPHPQVRASSKIYRGFTEVMVGLGAHAQELSSLYSHCDHHISDAMEAQRAEGGACWPAAPPKLQAVLAKRRAEQKRLEAACASLQAALPNARFEGRSFPVPLYERLCFHVSRILQTSLQLLDVLEDSMLHRYTATRHPRAP